MAKTPMQRNQGPISAEGGVHVGNNVWIFSGTGAPVDGTSGTGVGFAGPGSLYLRTAGTMFQNTGTMASPTWSQRT